MARSGAARLPPPRLPTCLVPWCPDATSATTPSKPGTAKPAGAGELEGAGVTGDTCTPWDCEERVGVVGPASTFTASDRPAARAAAASSHACARPGIGAVLASWNARPRFRSSRWSSSQLRCFSSSLRCSRSATCAAAAGDRRGRVCTETRLKRHRHCQRTQVVHELLALGCFGLCVSVTSMHAAQRVASSSHWLRRRLPAHRQTSHSTAVAASVCCHLRRTGTRRTLERCKASHTRLHSSPARPAVACDALQPGATALARWTVQPVPHATWQGGHWEHPPPPCQSPP